MESACTYRPNHVEGSDPLPFMYRLLATFLLTGGPESEVLGLEVDDASFDRRIISVRPNEHRRLKRRRKQKRKKPRQKIRPGFDLRNGR